MTKEDIIRMARQAGWSGLYITYNEPTGKTDWKMVKERLTVPVTMEQIERFAALIAAAEREACADICDQHASIEGIAQRCAAEIRARNNP